MTDTLELRPQEIAAILARYPGLGLLRSVKSMAGGTAGRNHAVVTDSGRYFLRQRNPRYTDEPAVAFDHRLIEYLATHGVPVVPALELHGLPGRRWLRLGPTQVLELYPWRTGQRFDRQSAAHLAAAGRALGAFHVATRRFHGPLGKAWPRYDAPAAILHGLRCAETLPGARAHSDQLTYLREQATSLAAALPDERYDALPRTVIHGDYHPANLIFQDDDVAGIFDLDWATCQPRLRDLADGVLFFAARRATDIDGGDIASLTQTPTLDSVRMRAFLDAYGAAAWPLAADELAALPEFIRARWLFCRVDALRKVPAERRLPLLLNGIVEPLDWLAAHAGEFTPCRALPS
jgi:Ser/Thr protein kinase RdoA (MazF antagonist)